MMTLNPQTTYQIATLDDVETLLPLVQAFHEYEELPFDRTLDRHALEQLLKNETIGKVWIIYDSDIAIGYVIVTFAYTLEYRGYEACIDEFYVRPAYRGQGIGTQTLQFVESYCQLHNINAISLEVAEDNNRAQRIYRKAGYDDRGYYLMTKPIRSVHNRENMKSVV